MLDMIITGQALRRATNEIFVFFYFILEILISLLRTACRL